MKNIKRLVFFIMIAGLFACAAPSYRSNVSYYDSSKEFKVTISANFQKCNEVGIKAVEKDKSFYELWERGGSEEITFFIKDTVLKEGENLFDIYCDKRKIGAFTIQNSKFPMMNVLNTKKENIWPIAENYKDVFGNPTFFKEFKDFMLVDKKNYDYAKDLISLLPINFKVELYSQLVERYKDDITLRSIAGDLKSALSEEKSEELILKLLNLGNRDVDSDLTYVILSKPVKRYYEKFFPLLVNKPHVYQIIEEHLRNNPTSEFSSLVFAYIKENAEKGNFNNFVNTFLYLALDREPSLAKYTLSLLLSGEPNKEALALRILKDKGIDEESGNLIIANWDNLRETVKKDLVLDLLKLYGSKNVTFFKRFLNSNDIELKKVLGEVGLHIASRYEDSDIVNFYMSNTDIEAAFTYFLNAPKDIKFNGLSKIYEKDQSNISALLAIEDANTSYFCEKLIKNFLLNKESKHKVLAAQKLASYEDRYLPELIKAYEMEGEPETRLSILAAVASSGPKGSRYAYEKIKGEVKTNANGDVYKNIAKHADEEIFNRILNELKDYPNDIYIAATIGLEEGRRAFNCEILRPIYKEKEDRDARFRVIWTWVYCCPDSYFDMFESLAKEMNEEIFLEAIDGVKDVIKDVKPALKEKGLAFLERIYLLKNTRAVRERIADLILEVGSVKDYNFLKRLYSEATTEEEKVRFSERIDQFKREKGIAE